MWTSDDVVKLATEEKVRIFQLSHPETYERMHVMWIIHEAVQRANERYMLTYMNVRRDLEIGLIGPTGQPQKTDRSAWIAGEVRRRLLTELERESPLLTYDDSDEEW